MCVPVSAGDWACEIELRQAGVIWFPWRQRSWSYSEFKSWIWDARCPFQWKSASSAQLWYIRSSAGRYVLQWDLLLDEGLAFVQAGVPPGSMTWRGREGALERKFQMWRRRCKQIDPHWFQGRFWWIWSTISWKYSIIYPVRLFSTAKFFNQIPPASYFQQFTGSCYSLWITGNSLWHRD